MPGIMDRDREFAEQLRVAGVLQRVEGHQLNLQQGAIVVMCADGDRSEDLFAHHAGLQRLQRPTARVQLLSENGGALHLAPDSPVDHHGRAAGLMADICGTRSMKGINIVALYVHAPCGIATAGGLSLRQELELLMAAKLRVKAMGGDGIKVACFVHLDLGDRMQTYFLSRERWEAWCAREHAASATSGAASAVPA